MDAIFNIGDKAIMMHENEPIKVTVIERRFIRRESIGMFKREEISVNEHVEYTVCRIWGSPITVREYQLFHTKEELFENLKSKL